MIRAGYRVKFITSLTIIGSQFLKVTIIASELCIGQDQGIAPETPFALAKKKKKKSGWSCAQTLQKGRVGLVAVSQGHAQAHMVRI